MIFPIADDNSDRATVPVVNYTLILINILVFVFLQGFGSNDRFTYAFSTVPHEIVTGRDATTPDRVVEHPMTNQYVEVPGLQPTPFSVYITLLTSMFMHGGWRTSSATCSFYGFSETTWKTVWGMSSICSFILSAWWPRWRTSFRPSL